MTEGTAQVTRNSITQAISAWVKSLESHEGAMTDRERRLCTTLLRGLAAGGQLVLAPVVPAEGLHPDYNYELASERERWHFDLGFESGHQAALDPTTMGIADVREVMEVVLVALTRLADEQAQRKATRD